MCKKNNNANYKLTVMEALESEFKATNDTLRAIQRTAATPTTAILEAITNGVSAAIPGTTAKVVVDIRESPEGPEQVRIMVLDYGVGMNRDELENLKNFGGKSGKSQLNQFGTGFNTFTMKLTERKRAFGVVSRKDGRTHVMLGPFKRGKGKKAPTILVCTVEQTVADTYIVPEDLIETYGEPVTAMFADAAVDQLDQLRNLSGDTKKKVRTLADIRRAVAEHISVRYWPLLVDDGMNPPKAEIYVHDLMVKNPKLGKKGKWTRPIRPLNIYQMAPQDGEKACKWTCAIEGKDVCCDYYAGILDKAAMATGFMGVEPLDIYYQGNMATSGFMVIQDGLVTSIPVFTKMFDIANHPSYNRVAGYLSIDGAPEDTLNMTIDKNGIDDSDTTWNTVFSYLRENKDLHPSRAAKKLTVADLQNKALSYCSGVKDFFDREIDCTANLAVDVIRVPVIIEDKERRTKTIYFFAPSRSVSKAAELDDYWGFLKYGAYLARKKIDVQKIVFVAQEFSAHVTEEYEATFGKVLGLLGVNCELEYMTYKQYENMFK